MAHQVFDFVLWHLWSVSVNLTWGLGSASLQLHQTAQACSGFVIASCSLLCARHLAKALLPQAWNIGFLGFWLFDWGKFAISSSVLTCWMSLAQEWQVPGGRWGWRGRPCPLTGDWKPGENILLKTNKGKTEGEYVFSLRENNGFSSSSFSLWT